MIFKYVGKYPTQIWEDGQGITVSPGQKIDLKERPNHKFVVEEKIITKIKKEVKEDGKYSK